MKVYLVTGYDVGANSGYTIERVFTAKADAEFYAEHAKDRKHNYAFDSGVAPPFEVEEFEVVASLEDVADELK